MRWSMIWLYSSPRLSPIKLPQVDLKDTAEWHVLVYSASYFQSHVGWVQSFTWLHIRRAGVLAQGFTILCRLVLRTISPGNYKQGRLKTHLTEPRPHQGFLRNGGTSVAPRQIPIKSTAPGKTLHGWTQNPKTKHWKEAGPLPRASKKKSLWKMKSCRGSQMSLLLHSQLLSWGEGIEKFTTSLQK